MYTNNILTYYQAYPQNVHIHTHGSKLCHAFMYTFRAVAIKITEF